MLSNKKLKSDINQGDENNCTGPSSLVAPFKAFSLDSITALHSACSTGAHSCVSVLLANGAEPNVVDCWQQTALFVAAEGSHTDCIIKVIIICSFVQSQIFIKLWALHLNTQI